MTCDHSTLIDIYKSSRLIHLVERRISDEYSKGEMRCPVHLSIGQELPSAIFSVLKKSGDLVVSTHRSHAHYLASGGNLNEMIAELYGKVDGCSRGRGGSMHLTDMSQGFIGSSAIVGNSIPLGVGAGMSLKMNKAQSVSFVFFGDGSTEEGAFYEAANFAAAHKIPTVFVCENNKYSVYTNLGPRQPEGRRISELAAAIGLTSEAVKLDSVEDAFERFNDLVAYSRRGFGPSFIEIETYRTLEHCGPNDDDELGYRPQVEIKRYKEEDPTTKLKDYILSLNQDKSEDFEQIDREILLLIEEAFQFARASEFPNIDEILGATYAQ